MASTTSYRVGGINPPSFTFALAAARPHAHSAGISAARVTATRTQIFGVSHMLNIMVTYGGDVNASQLVLSTNIPGFHEKMASALRQIQAAYRLAYLRAARASNTAYNRALRQARRAAQAQRARLMNDRSALLRFLRGSRFKFFVRSFVQRIVLALLGLLLGFLASLVLSLILVIVEAVINVLVSTA